MTTFLEQQFGLGGQVAVVFGAASGIGRRCAAFLSKAGAKVCLVDLDGEAARAAAQDINPGAATSWAGADVSDEAQVTAALAKAEGELGPVTIVVNSAGVFPSIELQDQSVESWDRVQAVNLRGSFLCVREGAKAIRKAGRGGRIILISSTTAFVPGVPTLGAYSASKAGVNALVRAAAMEYAEAGITVNAVAPGDTQTEGAAKAQMAARALPLLEPRFALRPMRRFGQPEDMAQAVLAFAAPGAEYVTGQVLVVDGGQLTA